MVCRGTWEAIKRSNSNSTYIYFHIAFYICPFGALGGAWALGGPAGARAPPLPNQPPPRAPAPQPAPPPVPRQK